MRRSLPALVSAVLMAGCSSKTANDGCSGNDDCSPGQVCSAGDCVVLCASDLNCAPGQICSQDVCVEGTRGTPTILSVDGVGPVDGELGHTDHQLETHLVLTGTNLDGSQVTVAPPGGAGATLEVCDASDTQLTLRPPTDLAAGTYVLTVTNQSGSCAADLEVIQGVQGPAGPSGPTGPTGPTGPAGSPDTGSEIIVKINDVATSGAIAPDRIDEQVMSGGGNMIPDPYFQHGMHFWTTRSSQGTGSIVTPTGPSPGASVFANDATQSVWLHSTSILPVEHTGRYTVRGMFRNPTSVGSAGRVFLAVLLFDDAMNGIAGDGSWWYYPASHVELTDTGWHAYHADFGASTARPFPPEARHMTVGAILNYDDGGVAGNRIYEVSGLGIYQRNPPVDMAWQGLHVAAAAACRGSTSTGGSGCCANNVRVRNVATAQSCSEICAANSETCDAEVSVTGYPGKATDNGQLIGRFYNYGCGGSTNGGSEASVANDAILGANSGATYYSFCCCRQ